MNEQTKTSFDDAELDAVLEKTDEQYREAHGIPKRTEATEDSPTLSECVAETQKRIQAHYEQDHELQCPDDMSGEVCDALGEANVLLTDCHDEIERLRAENERLKQTIAAHNELYRQGAI